jgi:hypothetical protein
MVKPQTFRVVCSSSLVLAGAFSLFIAIDLALKGQGRVVWMGAVLLLPLIAFVMLLMIALAYKRVLRRSIVDAASVASEPQQLQEVLERLGVAEAWIGPLQLKALEESVRKMLGEGERAVLDGAINRGVM